tara:strand:+ start:58359 stop:60059 length:1701 start_codon:yes stop_codon:yes gene_type:complete
MTIIQTTQNRRRKKNSKSFQWDFLISRIRNLGYSSSTYRKLISGKAPQSLVHLPADIRPGDIALGNQIILNNFVHLRNNLDTKDITCNTSIKWNSNISGIDCFIEFHGFSWLKDLKVVSNESAKEKARQLIGEWVSQHTSLDSLAWRPDVLGQRLYAWLAHANFLLADSKQDFKNLFLSNLALQSRHLSRTIRHTPHGSNKFSAIKGLYACGICIPENERFIEIAEKELITEIERQILPDGGHIERSPASHLNVMCNLIEIKATVEKAELNVTNILTQAIDTMAPMLRSYRHGDGAMGLFNDSLEEAAWLIDLILTSASSKVRAHSYAPHTGFCRVQAGRTLLIIDTGFPAKVGNHSHAGTLSFELSVGKERLIVNCGASRGGDPEWRDALRATAAHSTLTIDDTNSSELLPSGAVGIGPKNVSIDRKEHDGSTWLKSSHDGYTDLFGLIHYREIYISPDGTDVRGQDILSPETEKESKGRSFAVRFHLHPDVQVSLVQNGQSVLLRLPNGSGWKMKVKGGNIDLTDSIYSGHHRERRKSNQIVITGPIEAKKTLVNWSLKRVPKG